MESPPVNSLLAASQNTAPLLSIRNASRLYGTVIGVNDINIDLPRGAYGLVGPNGAGKSTLIGLITGALTPTLGSIEVFGQNPRSQTGSLHRIGLCPASDLLLPKVPAKAWLEQLLALHGWPLKMASQRAAEVLAWVGLAQAMNRPMGSYSLGMRQRAKLAQALSHDPELLILDEPFNGLDPVGRLQMIELLKQWVANGRSLLLASHVLHEVEAVTNAFMLIYGGRLLAVGTAGELRTMLADLPQEVTLEGPDSRAIAACLAQETWIQSIRVSPDSSHVVVAVLEPLRLYSLLNELIHTKQFRLTGIRGETGDLSALFRLLVSRHRGQNIPVAQGLAPHAAN